MDTIVIGLDAATWRVVDPLLSQGRLPNMASIIDRGTRGDLHSTRPPLTPIAWTSMVTGVNPGKHGIYDFLSQDEDSYQIEPVRYSRMQRPALWDLLDNAGVSSGFVDFPMVQPPSVAADFFISGIPASVGDGIISPPSLSSYLEEKNYRINSDEDPKRHPEQYFLDLRELTRTQAEVAMDLGKQHGVDILWPVFMAIDWAQHYLWETEIEGMNAVEKMYEFIDGIVGDFSEEFPNTNIFIVSDHGARRTNGEIHTNSVLEELGYLRRSQSSNQLRDAILKAVWRIGRQFPHPVRDTIREFVPSTSIREMREAADFGRAGQLNLDQSIDWDETIAFSYGSMGRVFINRGDRYERGIVEPENVIDIRSAIATDLRKLTDSSGTRVIEDVSPADETYTGPCIENRPSLLFTSTDEAYTIRGDFDDPPIHEPTGYVGDHESRGLFMAAGPDITKGELDADVVDITPTLLGLAGTPLLDDMDGQMLQELLSINVDPDVVSADALQQRESTGNDAFEEDVVSNLEDLGYL